MRRRSLVASITAAVLALGVATPMAMAVQTGDETAAGLEPVALIESPETVVVPEAEAGEAPDVEATAPAEEAVVEDSPAVEEELPAEGVGDEADTDVVAPVEEDAEEAQDPAEEDAFSVETHAIGTIPGLDELLDPSALWPLPTGFGTAEPDPVFKRGPSGFHDPFVVGGGFLFPNLDLLAAPLQSVLKSELCGNPTVTTAVNTAVRIAATVKVLPVILTDIDGMSPDAVGLCESYVDSLTPSDVLSLTPLNVSITMTNRDDPSDVRSTTVPFESGSFILGTGYVFAALSTDFPGGYFNAGTYDITAELMTDASVGLPARTMSTTVDWTGRRLAFPPSIVSGTDVVNVDFPPIDLSYTFTNEPIAKLLNTPTMTVVEAPTVDASWDYSVGLRVNDDGYDGIVDGTVGFSGSLDDFNAYFRTDILLYRVGNVVPVERIRVALDEDFNFSHEFTDLGVGNYYAIPVVSSTRFLPVPVQGDLTRLQVINIRADFEVPELDCLEELGTYTLKGSVHNNAVAPIPVKVTLTGPAGDGVLGSEIVLPTRTHYEISSDVGPGDFYGATFSALGAKTVTIDGPAVAEPTCAEVVILWDPMEATNFCPVMTADATLNGWVEGYRDGYNVAVTVTNVETGDEVVIHSDVEIAVDEEDPDIGRFSIEVPGLVAGSYDAVAVLTYNDGFVEEVLNQLAVEITDCGELSDVAFTEPIAKNVCPAVTADATLTGTLINAREDHDVTYDLFVETDSEEQPWLATGRMGFIGVQEDGTFSVLVTGLEAGKYMAVVNLAAGEEQVEEVDVYLEVQISDCSQPGPKPTPDVKPGPKPGTLAKTGAFALPILLLGLGGVAAGTALKRRSNRS